MNSKPPIAYIDIRVTQHATEDPQKVQAAIKNLLTAEQAENLIFQKTSTTGHHNNPIIIYTAKLTDKKTLPETLEKIGQNLSAIDKEQLNQDIKLHIEKSNLYLRFDKQSALQGTIKLAQTDPIHIKIHFKNKTLTEITDILKQAGLLP
jgi:RNA binding exosome subunit